MSEWDNTPWAGEVVKSLALKPLSQPLTVKAVTGAGVTAYAQDLPLSRLMQTPQQKCAAFLRAYQCGWFYKAESKISGDLATLPWTVTDGDIESEDPAETEIPRPDLDIPFAQLNPIEQFMRLMERPNPYQTGRQLRQKTFIRRDMAGVAFWYLEAASERSPITAIYGISPSRLWPSYDKKTNQLIGYVLDYDRQGGTMTFEPWEIVPFSNASADEDMIFGVGVVEAVYAELPLTDLLTRHTADLLSTGGRLAGMLWPKERPLGEDEFTDAQRAWRNVVSDPASARRLLLFPEPMEWSAGASTPAEIGIPELATLNRDNILTAFPIAPEILGVQMPSGLNASGETRRQLYDFYWSDTIGPRQEAYDEVIQTVLISRYEALMGGTFRYETDLPKLDDAAALLEKAGAMRSLMDLGFDAKDTIKAVGLDHIKWTKPPKPEPVAVPEEQPALTASMQDDTAGNTNVQQQLVTKSRAVVADTSKGRVQTFLHDQKERVAERIRESYPARKAVRRDWVKAPDWWDKTGEDRLLLQSLLGLYLDASRDSLQVVADTLNRIIPNRSVQRVLDDVSTYGGVRISDINEATQQALAAELSLGVERGYSIPQLIDGVPEENYAGVKGVNLDNGVPAFGDARAETIARTETALSYNRAALDAYREFQVSHVIAYDGDYDEVCAARNGQEFTIAEALEIEDHPNGTLDWAPIVDKAEHLELRELREEIAAIKADRALPIMVTPNINITMPEQQAQNARQPEVLDDVAELANRLRPTINARNVDFPITVDTEAVALVVRDIETAIREQPIPVVNVAPTPPAPVIVARPKASDVQDVRIIDDVSPPKIRRVVRDKQGRVDAVVEGRPDGG